MSLLSKLSLSDKSPHDGVSPVDRKRRRLLEQLDQQMIAAKLALENKPATREVQRWTKVVGTADKQLVTKLVPIRKWWWASANGQIMFSLRQGNRVMEIAPGKLAIEVRQLANLPDVLSTVREAIENGELDEQLKVSPYVRPIPKKGGKG